MGQVIGTHIGGIGGTTAAAFQGDTGATKRAAQINYRWWAAEAADTAASLDICVCRVEQGGGGNTNHTNEHAPIVAPHFFFIT